MAHHTHRYSVQRIVMLLALAIFAPVIALGNVAPAQAATVIPLGYFTPQVNASGVTDDWTTYQHDNARTSASADTTLSAATASQLGKLWSFKACSNDPSNNAPASCVIAAEPAIVSGVVYVGSWDGYEYALSATTGAVIWKTYLGVTNAAACNPPHPGVTSGATVLNGVVYVGGGDDYWYALNAADGSIKWKVYVGDSTATGGNYNFASPLVANGYMYIGVASLCDDPLVQGKLLKVDLSDTDATSHQIVGTTKFVPDGQVGGGIWTSPAYDAATNTIYVTTGTQSLSSQNLAQAMVSINASTMAVIGSWGIPPADAVIDSDWGTSPTIYTNSQGQKRVFAVNKNGYMYDFDATNISAGPLWRDTLFIGGDCPTCGEGSVSSATFANGTIYQAGGNSVINGVGYAGAVYAINGDTGAIIWAHGDPNPIIPAIAYDNGMVIAGAGPAIEALDASTGARLYSYVTGKYPLFGAPAVAEGEIVFGAADGTIYSFGQVAPTVPPTDANCPSGWTCQDIGSPATAGSESIASGVWTVSATGTGVTGTSDQFRLMTQNVSGDTQVIAQITAQQAVNNGGQAGIMLRQSNVPGSPYYAVFLTPNKGVVVQYRSTFGGSTTTITPTSGAAPVYLEVQRKGDTFNAAAGTDGSNFTLVPGSTVTLALPATLLAGLAASSSSTSTTASDTFANVAVSAPNNTIGPPPFAHACPSGWTCTDVGNPALVGDQTVDGSGNWAVIGGGADVGGYSDQFHFVSQSFVGDGSINAHVSALTNTNGYAKAGMMIRATTDANSAFYAIFITPSNGLVVEYRPYQGGQAAIIDVTGTNIPVYLKVGRLGNIFTAYTSTDGANWTLVAGSNASLTLPSTVQAGMAVTSHNVGTAATGNFDTVVVNGAPPPPLCPTNWTCADVGNPPGVGSQSVDSNGVWTIQGNGNDIWGTSDQFHYVYQTQPSASDITISAQVASQDNTSQYAKTGVMLRASTDPTAPFYAMVVTPTNGIYIEARTTTGGNAVLVTTLSGAAPTFVEVARSGNTFTAYTSSDGATWTAVLGSNIAIPALNGALLSGMAITSHSGTLATATVDVVTITQSAPPPPPDMTVCPTGWSCVDVGNPAATGGQNLTNNVWTVQSTGSDIWGTSDQFHFVYQTLTADGTFSAHVTTQNNTNAWAKGGIMLRVSTDPGSIYYGVFVTPGNGIVVQYRTTAGGSSSQVQISGVAPVYLQIARSGNSFTAYTSSDGTNWTPIYSSTVTITLPANTAMLAGLAVASHAANVGQVTYDTVNLANTAPPPPLGSCPTGWSCGDIGSPTLTGGQSLTNGVWTVSGSGSDIWGTSDQFHFVSKSVAGNGMITAQVTAQSNTDPWAKAGVMFRASGDPGAAYYAVFVTPGNGIAVQYRTASGASAQHIAGPSFTLPVYLRVARFGNAFLAYTSTDGATWTLVPGSAVALNVSGAMLAGMAVTSHNTGSLSIVKYANVAITAATPVPPTDCPSGWTCADIGSPAKAGGASLTSNGWIEFGGGSDITGTSDQFHYIWQPLAGDGTFSAQVANEGNTSAYAKTGVMIRQTNAANSAFYAVFVTPGHGILIQYRKSAGGTAAQITSTTGAAPIYVEIVRNGYTYTAYTSPDDVTWTAVANSKVTMGWKGSALAGIPLSAHSTTQVDAVAISNATITLPQAPTCPSGWTCADVGAPAIAGSQTLNNGVWVVQGAGVDITSTSDQFHYVYQSLTGDGGVSGRVTAQSNTSSWAKGGLMLRGSTAANAAFYAILVTPGNGYIIEYRAKVGGGVTVIKVGAVTLPMYLKVMRSGTSFTAYTSADGNTWTAVPNSTVTLANLTGTLLSGMAVTSHNATHLGSATFDTLVAPATTTATAKGMPAAPTPTPSPSPSPSPSATATSSPEETVTPQP